MENIEHFLKDGPLTKVTPFVLEKSREINSVLLDYPHTAINVIEWMGRNFRGLPSPHTAERDAEKILRDGYVANYLDVAIVFTAVCRAKVVPVRWVEAISLVRLEEIAKSYSLEELKKTDLTGHIFGHFFLEVPDRGVWVASTLPKREFRTEPGIYLLDDKRYAPLATGLDSKDIHISTPPVNMLIYEVLKKRMQVSPQP